LDGPNGVLASQTSTPKRTPKNVRTTADVKSTELIVVNQV
jgi:hypothetical protein